MPEYLHPGVYIEEIERGPRPIEGVPTSTAAFLGEAERGPIKPRLVTSYKEYQRWFGSVFGQDKFLPYAVNGFFENGGKRVYICRLVGMLVRKKGVLPTELPPTDGVGKGLENGADDPAAALGLPDFVGDRPDPNTQGLSALLLDPYRDVALVYAPGITSANKDIAQAIISHCEKLRFRFAVIDSPKGQIDLTAALLNPRNMADTSYAAFYYPWIWTADPATGARKLIPPGGHTLGVYSRVDSERGVFKSPANETLRGVLDLEYDIGDGAQDVLNPQGVNAIRRFPSRGIRIWGARNITSDALWKYICVRILFIFLEHSIYDGTQWVVFEPNDPRLWARVTDTIRIFLRAQWRLGALYGRTEEQAFFVTCNETVMSPDDILNGRLVCEIGIAPVRPAEFVIFRIFQNTAEAQR
jgi:phage tail sheath protein FI